MLVSGITAFLMIGVVPGFRDVFDSLDAELPALTATVLGISEWMQAHWVVMLASLVGGVFGLSMFRKTEVGQLAFDHLSLNAPVFGPLFRKVALARFSRTFATLIRSGVPIMATLDIVADTAGNRVIAGVVRGSRDSVRSGNMLSEPLAQSSVFPPMVVKMIAIGERSGALEVLLEKIAEFYDGQVKAAVKGLTSMIEPILITVMGVMVGGVVLSVFLPILEVVGNLSPS
jgi:type IV pilus assembly protein PilC